MTPKIYSQHRQQTRKLLPIPIPSLTSKAALIDLMPLIYFRHSVSILEFIESPPVVGHISRSSIAVAALASAHMKRA